MFKVLALTTLMISSSVLANDIGYSGRLVKVDGSPVTGTPNLKFEITYSGSPSTIECTETINSVPLNNGVFNVKLDFDATTTCVFNDVLNATPSGQTVRIRVTDETNSNTYDYQSISNVPLAYKAEVSKLAETVKDGSIVASSLNQMSATTGQVLKWNGTAWAPAVDGGASGTITNITAGLGVLKSGIATSPTFALDVSSTFFDFAGNSLNLKDNSVTPVKIPFNSQHFDAANLVQLNLKLNTAGAITSGVTGLGVNVDNTTLEIVGNQLRVKAVPAGNIPDAEGLNTSCADGKVLKASGGSVICGDDTDTDTQLTDTQVDTFVGNELTAGKLPYKSGTELVDSQIHQDGSSRIGIGTTSPTSKLTVSSAGSQLRLNDSANAGVALGLSVQDTGSSNQASFDVLNGGSEHATFRFFRNTNTTGNKTVLFKKGNGSDTTEGQIGVDGSDSFFQVGGGNFGIGTNTPSAKLEVNGQVKITGGTPGLGKILTSDAAGLASWQTPPSGADNLGDHTATTHLKLEGNRLTTDADEDTYISSSSDDQIDFRVGGNNSLRLWQNALDTNNTGSFSLKTNGAGTVTDAAYSFAGDTNTGLFRPSADHLAITTGGTERLRVDSTGNIAVGKTTAAAKLDVNGNIRATEICDETGSNCKDISTGWSDANATSIQDGLIVDADINASANIAQSKISGLTTDLSNKLETSRVNNGALGTSTTDVPTQNAVKTYVDSATVWEKNASHIYFNTGRVGIGTNNPSEALDVDGTAHLKYSSSNSNSLKMSSSPTWYGSIIPFNSSGRMVFGTNYNGSDGGFEFKVDNTLMMRLDHQGNLGVGTGNPQSKLDVSVSSGTTLTASSASGNHARIHALGDGYSGAAALVLSGDNESGNYKFVKGVNDYNANDEDGGAAGSTETFHVTGSGDAYFAGDLEVKSQAKLGTIIGEKYLSSTSNGWYRIGILSGGVGDRFEIEILGASGYSQLDQELGKTVILGSFGNNATSGSANIQAKFYHEGGDPVLTEVKFKEVTRSQYEVHANIGTFSNHAYIAKGTSGTKFAPEFTSSTNPGTNSATVKIANNEFNLPGATQVGIGTVSPSEKLDVVGNVKATAFIGDGSQLTGINASSSSNTSNVTISADSDSNSSGDILLNTAGSTKVIVKNDGKLGVGTTTPAAQFDVAGGAFLNSLKLGTSRTLGGYNNPSEAASGDYGRIDFGSDATDGASIYSNKNGSITSLNFLIRDDANDYFDFRNQSSSLFKLTQDGKAGFGTSNPLYNLHVNGTNARVLVGDGTNSLTLGQWDTATNRIESANRQLFLTSYSNGLAFGNNGNKEMVLSTGGHVGIGTTTPTSALTIERSDNAGIKIQDGTNSVAILGDFGAGSDGQLGLYDGSGGLTTVINGGANSYFTGGNIGIGTTSPNAKLDIAGDLELGTSTYPDGDINLQVAPSGDNVNLNLKDGADTTAQISFDGWGSPNKSGSIHFLTSPIGTTANLQNRMMIHEDGNVGIGTTTPRAKLEVNGNFRLPANGGHYTNSIMINGDANTYYPVVFDLAGGSPTRSISYEFNITRGYTDTAPTTWNNATHKGGLQLKFYVNHTSWGGDPGKLHIDTHRYTYSTQVAAVQHLGHGYRAVVWLRGGGASYQISGTHPVIGSDPQILYASGLIYDHANNTYDVSVAPKTTVEIGIISPTDIARYNGNVGIGTSTPTAKLEVAGSVKVNGVNYVEMATFRATSASASNIVSTNNAFTQLENHPGSPTVNTDIFEIVTTGNKGIRIKKAGLVTVSVGQDIITAGTTGYATVFLHKNGSPIYRQLRTNTNGQWDSLQVTGTFEVAANDIISIQFSAADITSFDYNLWGQYNFTFVSR